MSLPADLPLEIDCHSTRQMQESGADFLFLDCREADEYETAAIDGTRLLPLSEIQERIGELEGERERRIIVHCHHGGRSLRVARWLRGQGFAGAQSLAGGIDEWSERIDSSVPRY